MSIFMASYKVAKQIFGHVSHQPFGADWLLLFCIFSPLLNRFIVVSSFISFVDAGPIFAHSFSILICIPFIQFFLILLFSFLFFHNLSILMSVLFFCFFRLYLTTTKGAALSSLPPRFCLSPFFFFDYFLIAFTHHWLIDPTIASSAKVFEYKPIHTLASLVNMAG